MNNIHGGDVYTYDNYLDFSTNINPLGIPKRVKEAAIQSLDICNQYPDVKQLSLKKALSSKEETDMEHIICGNGAADLIFSLCLAKKPQKALLLAPTFSEYEQALLSVDCSIIYHFLKEEDNFLLKSDFFPKLTNDIDIVFLCNPNNPTGNVISTDVLRKILSICEENKTLLVLDECFNDFLDAPLEYTLRGEVKHSPYLFILKAFTKLYAMPGLRLGYGLCSNTNLLNRINQVTQPWRISIPATYAGITALEEVDYVKKTNILIKEERKYLLDELSHYGFKVYDSKANYIFFKGPDNFYDAMLKENILIRNCSNYRGLTQGYYRIAVKNHDDNILFIKKVRQLWQNQL
jgi:threonine-phosphate decarboxylase